MKKLFLIFISLTMIATNVHAEKLRVILDWFVNPNHAPLIIAKEKGFFAAQNLDVDIIAPSDSADPPKMVAAGHADIAVTYQPRLLQQVEHGLPLIMVGSLINQPLNCLVTNKDIQSLSQLKNKRIGYSGGSLSNITLNVMLKDRVAMETITLINIHYALTQSLLTRSVDAVTGMMRNFEVVEMEQLHKPVHVFYPEHYGMPTYNELIYVANKNMINKKVITKFLQALEMSTQYIKKNPQEAWQLIKSKHPELNNALNDKAWVITLPYLSDHPQKINVKQFMVFAKFMKDHGLIQSVKPATVYVNMPA